MDLSNLLLRIIFLLDHIVAYLSSFLKLQYFMGPALGCFCDQAIWGQGLHVSMILTF